MEKRELTFGVYTATERFKSVAQHACVCFKDDMGLVASTGPAGDKESEEYAELFAAAPEMKEALLMAPEPVDLEQGIDTVEHFIDAYFEWYEKYRDTALAKAKAEEMSGSLAAHLEIAPPARLQGYNP